MKAKDVMTQRVISILPDATIAEAIRLMLQNHISGLPVIGGDGALVGMVTEGDFLRRAETGTERRRPSWLEFILGPGRAAAEFTHSRGRKIAEVMTDNPLTVSEEAPLDEIVSLMERRRIKRLPVTRDGRVVGIVSRANLMRAIIPIARKMPSTIVSDNVIRDHVMREMESQKWAPRALVNVTVHDGVVDFCGAILDERDRMALKVLAENVPGVKAVHDHMAWVEPMSGMAIGA